MKINTITLYLLLFTVSLFAQNETLFTVNETPVSTTEFIRVYNKNINLVQDESQKDVNEYLKLYVNYKLKLAEAKDLELDKNPKYIRELKTYRNQLAQKYLTDTDINDRLIKEAYSRTLKEVNVNHILVKCAENATPADTLLAYNKVLEYRKQALKEGFETTMQTVNNASTVFGESLGYFDAFKMVYSFENVAYSTKVGEVSMPFRTQFGYHILHVLDKRKSRGEVEVAHIMVAHNNKKLTGTPKQKIEDLYKQLQEGAQFKDLAKQFSDDQGSAIKGGVLARFGAGKISDLTFENTAFSLKEAGELSKPIQSKYGWHIIKLLNKFPVPELAKIKGALSQKIKKDSRSKIVNNQFFKKLKKRYNFKEDKNTIANLLKVVDQSFLGGRTTNAEKNETTLFSFANKKYSYAGYYKYLRSKIRGYKNLRNVQKIVTESYNDFVNKQVYSYQDENLENEYEDFAAIMQEYRDGLLLFDLMEKQVWQKAKKDTVGLQKFYENNTQNYIWDTRIDAVIVTSTKKASAKKACKLLSGNKNVETIKTTVKGIVVSEGIFEKSDKEVPQKLKLKIGVSKIYKQNNQYVIVKINKVLTPSQKEFDEVKGRVINDYQEYIEKDWLQKLKVKYPVHINQSILEKVKNQL